VLTPSRALSFVACHLLVLSGWLGVGVQRSQAALEDEKRYRDACAAMTAGLPGVAAMKAEALLEEAGERLTGEEAEVVAELVVEGWTRAGEPDRVLERLNKQPKPHGTIFWRGQALLQKGEIEAAEGVLREWARAGRKAEQARLALALAFQAQGREALARRELKELRQSEDHELARRARLMFNESELTVGREQVVLDRLAREEDPGEGGLSLLKARALVQSGDLAEASAQLEKILKGSVGGARLHHQAMLLQAEVLITGGKGSAAQELILKLLASGTGTEFRAEAFEVLDRVLRRQDGEPQRPLPAALLEWMMAGADQERQGHVLFLVAKWLVAAGRPTEAVGLLETLLSLHPGHRKESEAMRLALTLHGQLGHDARVLYLAEAWQTKYGGGGLAMVDAITGGILFARGDYQQALARFQRAADLSIALGQRRKSLFNAAVAAVRAGELAVYASLLGQLQIVTHTADQGESAPVAGQKSGETAADLQLDHALDMAAKADAGAAMALAQFIEAYPDHGRWAEAQIAQAELALLDVPPRIKAADLALNAAAERIKEEESEMLQRISYTRMWSLEVAADWKGVASTGQAFLVKWPQAELAAEVRMKVADAYFRQEDFANAQTQFELVAKQFPTSEFAEAAVFLAGRAAMNLRNQDAAIELWEDVASQNGALARVARIQQALAKRREGKEQEALKVVDGLLIEKTLDADNRRWLSIEKAELLILLGTTNAKQLSAAVSLLKAFLGEADLPLPWRAKAGYWLAYAQRAQQADAEAVEACYDVTRAVDENNLADPDAMVWYFKTGFLAVELLEGMKNWEGAATMAERLAASGGERAIEAKDIATKIRLERFLWDERK
jgi:Tfp pilus assembly protein PilF